ncbi:DUF799 family lipoprotein [Pluralibacter gergoviae]
MSATGNIVMRSGENRTESSGSNKSRGGSEGVGLTAGQAGAGLTVSASGNQSKGRENGSSLTNTETTIAAGRDARFSSGQDLILDGAQASGRSVTADVGRGCRSQRQRQREPGQDEQQLRLGEGVVGYLRGERRVQKYSDSVTEKSHDVAQITSARMFTAGSDGGLLYGPRSPKYGKTAL